MSHKAQDNDKQTQSKSEDKKLLDSPIIYTVEDQTEFTGWANTYTNDDGQEIAHLSIQAEENGTVERFPLFMNKDFRPYFTEAVQKFREEQGGEE